MAVKFNPFTGQLQIDEKGSGGGSSVIEGEVDTYSDLPLDGSAALNSSWLVRTASGSWFTGGSKPAGIYVRVNTAGSSRDNDYVYAGLLPSAFSDSELKIYDNGDSTKTAQFQLSGITTGQNRVVSLPDKNITLDDSGDSRTPVSHAASHAAGQADELFDQSLNTTDNVIFGFVTSEGLEFAGEEGIGWTNEDGKINTRTNLGLGTAATSDSTDFAAATHTHTAADIDSGAAAANTVLTADGLGGSSFQPASGGGASIMQAIAVGFVLN